MRSSALIGIIILAAGIFVSYLSDELIATQTAGLQATATTTAAVIFVALSAALIGVGAGLLVHWIIGFAVHWKAFMAEIIIGFATFFIGIGASLMSGNWWTGMQVFCTFLIASITIFVLSFTTAFSGVKEEVRTVKKGLKKWKKKRT
ncbi:MAG: hypothetical protein EPN86_02915 [Nanoarchaeota archaeon]|nr:MAG: hypothetical protein EPN86_02915 [Nanoarchaeota archaeon]